MYQDNLRLAQENERLLQWQQVALRLSADNRELRGLLESARAAAAPGGALRDFAWLSMVMTGDFETAIEEGAHFIRIGTGLFGAREP